MSKKRPVNMAASVRAKLTEFARQRGEDLQLVLTRYAIERVLYRLTQTAYAKEFVLKGAILFRLWVEESHRPTRDLDLLGRGDPSASRMAEIFRAICTAMVEDDGLVFDPQTVTADKIKEDQEYEGVRVVLIAKLGQARIDLQVDVGFGDIVTPKPTTVRYPSLLDYPSPELAAYPRETVVAEKFQAMVTLGIANSRMKDFFDLWVLANAFSFDGVVLANAIEATFARRRTNIPMSAPLALTEEFGKDARKMTQWKAFLNKGRLQIGETDLAGVCAFLAKFLMPPTHYLAHNIPFEGEWPIGGPWSIMAAES